MLGRLIRIFLVDGSASGLRTAELGLSTIKALAAPRASLMTKQRPEAQKTGIYVLIGPDLNNLGTKIYVGEGDVVFPRLVSHSKEEDKEFWEHTVVLVSKDENLTKAHVRYLEARLIALAREAKRCTVTNGTAPSEEGKLPDPDRVEMEEFISQARLLLGTLGYDFFEPSRTTNTANPSTEVSLPEFSYSGDGFSASCWVDVENGQFIVKKDSTARVQLAGSMSETYKNLRQQLVDNGVLKNENGTLRFIQDYAFSAITAAAQVVSGQTVSGRKAWTTASQNKTFADWEDEQLNDSNV